MQQQECQHLLVVFRLARSQTRASIFGPAHHLCTHVEQRFQTVAFLTAHPCEQAQGFAAAAHPVGCRAMSWQLVPRRVSSEEGRARKGDTIDDDLGSR